RTHRRSRPPPPLAQAGSTGAGSPGADTRPRARPRDGTPGGGTGRPAGTTGTGPARARPATLAWPDRPSPCRTDRGAAARRGRRPDDVSAAGRGVPSRPGRVPGGGGSDPRPERAPLVVRGRGASVGPAGSPPAPATGGRRPPPGPAGAGAGPRGAPRAGPAVRARPGRPPVVRRPFG